MTELAERSTSELLEHLPPVEKSPILQTLARVGLEIFQREYLLDTPNNYGVVDHDALITLMQAQVDSGYRWEAPFFDEHHLNWYAHLYEAPKHDNPELAQAFRELPTNKLWVPRQFHNFVHTVTAHPPVPELEVMREEIRKFRRNQFIFRVASQAITIQEQIERAQVVKMPDGEVMLIDKATHRTYHDADALEERREAFVRVVIEQYKRGFIDLENLSPMDMVDRAEMEARLPEVISAVMSEEKFINRKSLRVDLPVNRPSHRGVNVA